jgi:hypothetical protein
MNREPLYKRILTLPPEPHYVLMCAGQSAEYQLEQGRGLLNHSRVPITVATFKEDENGVFQFVGVKIRNFNTEMGRRTDAEWPQP